MNGDRVSTNEVMIEFQQASFDRGAPPQDNEASLVATLKYGNHLICIPGDLEGEGQSRLMSSLQPCDLLISPHHGSLNSNTRELADKVQPSAVVVSSGTDRSEPQLRELYGPSPVLFTAVEGAVTYRISPAGTISLESFLNH
jgi:competence protein ComEC